MPCLILLKCTLKQYLLVQQPQYQAHNPHSQTRRHRVLVCDSCDLKREGINRKENENGTTPWDGDGDSSTKKNALLKEWPTKAPGKEREGTWT